MARRPKSIIQRISLDGGEEIRKELSQLGAEGEKIFKRLQAAANASSTGELGGALKNLRQEFKSLGDAGSRVGRDFSALRGSFTELGGALRQVGQSIAIVTGAAVAAGAAIFALAKSGANAADAAGKQAAAVGLSVEAYGGLQFAAEQSGVAAEGFATSMSRLNQTIGQALGGSAAAIDKFRQLGVSLKDSAGRLRPNEEILGDIAERFARLPDGARKSALAIELFGRSGAQLIPFLNEGRDGIAALIAQAERLGITFTREQVLIATAMNDSLSALRRAVGGIRNQIGLLFAPDITAASDFLTRLIEQNRVAVQAFARVIADEALGTVRDFFRILTGDEANVERSWLIDWTNAVKAFSREVSGAFNLVIIPAYRAFIGVLNLAAGAFNALFGTSLSGGQLAIVAVVAKFSGALALLAASLKVAVAGVTLFVSSFAFLAQAVRTGGAALTLFGVGLRTAFLAVGGFVAAGALIILYFDEIKAGAERLFDFLGQLFTGDFSGAWETFKEAGLAAFKGLAEASAATWVVITAAALKAFFIIRSGAIATAARVSAAFAFSGASALFAPLVAAARAAFASIGASAALGFAAWPVAMAAAAGIAALTFRAYAKEIGEFIGDEKKRIETFAESPFVALINEIERAAKALLDATGVPDGGLLGGLFGKTQAEADALKQEVAGVDAAISDLGKDADLSIWQKLLATMMRAFGATEDEIAASVGRSNAELAKLGADGTEDAFLKMAKEQGIAVRRLGDDFAEMAKAAGFAVRSLPDAVREGADEAKAAITDLNATISKQANTGEANAVEIKKLYDESGEAISRVIGFYDELGRKVQRIIPLDEPFGKMAEVADSSVRDVNANLDAIDAAPAFARVVDRSREAHEWMVEDAERTAARIQEVYSTFGDFQEGADDPSFYEPMTDGAETAFQQIIDLARSAWEAITSEFGIGSARAAEVTGQAFEGQDWQGIGSSAASSLSEGLTAGLGSAWAALASQARDAAQEIESAFRGLGERIEQSFSGIGRTFSQVVAAVTRDIDSAISRLIATLGRLEAAARRAAAAAAAANAAAARASSSGAEGFASGGMIHGPGTGTSDSIPAWLSAGEFVNRAASVRHYGAEIFAALNQMKIPRKALLELMGSIRRGGRSLGISAQGMKHGLPAFNMGGLAEAMNQRFSVMPQPLAIPNMGGAGASDRFRNMQPVTIDMGGGRQIAGLYAGPDVIDELMRASSEQQMLSIGPAPSWSGRR